MARADARDWLLSVLFSTYRSAKIYQERIMSLLDNDGIDPSSLHETYDNEPLIDIANRLLRKDIVESNISSHDINRYLSDRDVLLAGGHSRLQALPLLFFSLLQCDAFRSSARKKTNTRSSIYRHCLYEPSPDTRCAATANAGAMPPADLARCIAPRLEVRDSLSGEMLDGDVPMTIDGVRESVLEVASSGTGGNGIGDSGGIIVGGNNTLLFLDSPCRILLFPSCALSCGLAVMTDTTQPVEGMRDPGGSLLPGTIRRSIRNALQSYRVPPPVVIVVSSDDNKTDYNHNPARLPSATRRAERYLHDALVEESRIDGRNFSEWCTFVAEILHG